MMTTEYTDSEKVELKRPWGKSDLIILRKNYETLSLHILHTLELRGELTLIDLLEVANKKFSAKFSGEVILTVKYDLESKGLIKVRRPERCVQMISLRKKKEVVR
jgi:hypothetical protein